MSLHRISLCGCDDTTAMDLELSDAELEFVQRLATESVKTSTYGCEPIMEVEPCTPEMAASRAEEA